jgi:hypothetical protein
MSDKRLVSFAERHPIFVPALRETYHFSTKQLVMNAILGLIAIPISYHFGLLTGIQVWAMVKTLFVVYIFLFLVTALFNFARSPLRLLADHHRQIAILDKRLASFSEANHAAIPAYLPAAELATPDVEFTTAEVVDAWLSDCSLDREKPPYAPSVEVRAMLANFYYKPEQGVPPFIDLKAHLSIADASGKPMKTRYNAVWDIGQEAEYKRFDTADIDDLIIALLLPDAGIATFEHKWRNSNFRPESVPLLGSEFCFQLDLIGKYQNETVMNKTMKFTLNTDPPKMELVDVIFNRNTNNP